MRKPPAKPPPPEMSYAEWRTPRALVNVPTTMGERDWRDQFIKGHTPERAAETATTYYRNTQAGPKGRR
jgi:hypothetical protein